jgi:hypothetical protein
MTPSRSGAPDRSQLPLGRLPTVALIGHYACVARRGKAARAAASPSQDQQWVVVEEVVCPDGNNDAAIRDFRSRRRDLTAEPDRVRIDVFCDRATGASAVRFLWLENPQPQPDRRKPRHEPPAPP